MSKIRVGGLGGFGENGKNLYLCEVDNRIFILDCGIKYPTSEFHGVDTIISDFQYLLDNKEKIQGVFLSHGHEDHIGGLVYLLKDINIPIYGSSFTIAILEDQLKEADMNPLDYELNVVNEDDTIKFGTNHVSFFATTHSIPQSLGIAIHTKYGIIVYTGDYCFDQNVDSNYKTSLGKISDLGKKGVLCLMNESIGATNSTGNLYFELKHKLNGIFNDAKGRIIVTLFSTDLRSIQQIIDMSIKYDKRIAIIGRKAQRIVDVAVTLGYLRIPEERLVNLRYIDDKNKNNDSDLVILVTGVRHEPFFMLQRMCKKIDRLIHINPIDNIIMMTSPVPGTEKMAARTLDILCRTKAKTHTINQKYLQASHASREEIKMMINLLKPKYIVPLKGDYRLQYAQIEIATELGYDPKQVVILDNGSLLVFDKGKKVDAIDSIPCAEVLIDGSVAGDVNDIVLRDRELLSNDGVMIIIANVNPRTKKVLSGPEIISKGFLYTKEENDIISNVKTIFNSVSEKHLSGKYINWVDYKKDVKDEINRYLYKEIKRCPVMIPIIISTEVS